MGIDNLFFSPNLGTLAASTIPNGVGRELVSAIVQPLGITEIMSQISQAGGLARPSRFSVQIIPPNVFPQSKSVINPEVQNILERLANLNGVSRQILGLRADWFKDLGLSQTDFQRRLDFMCNRAELPGKSFSTVDVRTYGSFFKMPFIDTYSDITLQFIVGADMLERHFFDAWSYAIQDPDTSDFNYVEDYGTTVEIYQLDEHDNATYGVRLFQCWPVGIGQMTLDYSERNSYHVLPVTFTYRKWVNLRANSSSPTVIENPGQNQQFGNTIEHNK